MKNIDLAFSKKNVEERKLWLSVYDKNSALDYSKDGATITEFIHKNLKHFSNYDNIRSIPNLMDGLKPSQRKVLYCCFKRNLTKEVKVSQLSGYVSEHADYHHGEESLQKTITSMAGDYVGSNNLNLLEPRGQFGSRVRGGKDASSARYLFTYLTNYSSVIFPKQDSELLEHNKGDEGNIIEPSFYAPIIPMLLVNGSVGIGTGYSTNIPCYNPKDIIIHLRNKINKKKNKPLYPWYRHFLGDIIVDSENNKIFSRGVYTVTGNIVTITELPVLMWTEDYKRVLKKLEEDNVVDLKENDTADKILFTLTFKDPVYLKSLIKSGLLEDTLSLVKPIQVSNMTAFGPTGNLKKYNSPEDIIAEYFGYRLALYEKRRLNDILKIENQLPIYLNKIRFINMIIKNDLTVFRVKKEIVIKKLETLEFLKYEDSFNYLLKITIENFTEEEIKRLEDKVKCLNNELSVLKNKKDTDLWLEELETLEKMI